MSGTPPPIILVGTQDPADSLLWHFTVSDAAGADITLFYGDGLSDTVPALTSVLFDHTYADAGDYTVTASSSAGGQADTSIDITVTAPPSNPTDKYRPTVQDVADLVRVRVVHEGGETVGDEATPVNTFDTQTWPTADDVERIITQATDFIFPQITGSVSEPWGPACKHLAALYAAILVESSYFREQLTDDMVDTYRDMLDAGIRGIGAAAQGGAATMPSTMIDTVVMRGVATVPPQYLWWLDMPEPWTMPANPPSVAPPELTP